MTLFTHKVRGDHRGNLVAIESAIDVPFDIKRVFYIFGTSPGTNRGVHSHHRTRQYLIALNGSCKVSLDNGFENKIYTLDDPSIGLLQDTYIWGAMHDFSPDCVLLVLASEGYDADDYIHDYEEFLSEVSV